MSFMAGIDLHMHSTASDGTLTPSELAKSVAAKGLKAAALTDHDTVAGVAEFKKECERLGVEAVSGVEISAKYKTEMHILGLFVDENNAQLVEKLDELKTTRKNRNAEMLALIQKNGFDITAEDIIGQKNGGLLENTGRAHMAKAFVKKGYADSVQDAFDKYLSKGKSCYISRKLFTPEESIKLIKDAGGIAVLAHPYFITKDKDELYELLSWLRKLGLDGVESWYSEYPTEYRDLCLEMCEKLDLMPTGGSDFHADNKPDIKIGEACGGFEIPYELFENLKKVKLERN